MPNNNNKRELSQEEKKQLLTLKSQYNMSFKTRNDSLIRGRYNAVKQIDIMLDGIIAAMENIDPSFARSVEKRNESDMEYEKHVTPEGPDSVDELEKELMDITGNDMDTNVRHNADDDSSEPIPFESHDVPHNDTSNNIDVQMPDSDPVLPVNEDVKSDNTASGSFSVQTDPNAQYDLIPLPSKGQCYVNKKDRLSVAYLTAADENLLTSPNLFESGEISTMLLERKVLDKDFDVSSLVSGDADAIMVFLRGTSYGVDFPIVATDPSTGKRFETTVDLSKLEYKPFTLISDEKGHFDFTMPKTGKKIKFRFLTKRDERLLAKINRKENVRISTCEIGEAVSRINAALKGDTTLTDAERKTLIGITESLEKLNDDRAAQGTPMQYTRSITNTMETQIYSVDGNTDRKFIHDFVMSMPASDSLAFRRYIYDNQPGVDFEVEVARPESLGGGSFKSFLEWDDYVFWHIS